jgi:hypothetical protein
MKSHIKKKLHGKFKNKQANWLLDIGQINSKGLSDFDKAKIVFDDIFYNKIDGSIPMTFRMLLQREYKKDKFPFAFENIQTWPSHNSAEYKNFVQKHCRLASDFLEGLSEFIAALRLYTVFNLLDKEGRVAEPSVSGDFTVTVIQDKWAVLPRTDNIKLLGPLALLAVLNGKAHDILKFCPNCNTLFYGTNRARKYCSNKCSKAVNYSLSQADPDKKIKDRLKSQKSYYKKHKWTDIQIVEKWLQDGVEAGWIKRYFPRV